MARRRGRGGRWRISALLMLAALATLLAGCAGPRWPWQQTRSAVGPLPDAQQILRTAVDVHEDPDQALDPIHAHYWSPGSAQITSLLYSGLFTLDARQRPVPALASDYKVSADGLRYTFHLRPDARFAEGTPLTSTDVAFSLDRAMTGCDSAQTFVFFDVHDQPEVLQRCGAAHPSPSALTTLVGDALLTPDPQTLVIVLTHPDDALLAKLAEPNSAIVERSFVTRYGAQWTAHLADDGGQGTSGMYRLAAYQPWGSHANGLLTLTRSPTWWGPRPRLREVTVAMRHSVPQSDVTPGPLGLSPLVFPATSTDDLVFDQTSTSVAGASAVLRGLKALVFPEMWVSALTLDPRSAPLSDIRLRQALALALDKTALARVDNQPFYATATDHLIPPGVGAYPAVLSGSIATAPLTGDVARAQALWQSYVQAECGGVASRCPTITAFYTGQTATTPLELAMLARWRATLPGIQLAPVETTGLLVNTDFPLPPQANDTVTSQNYADPQDRLLTFAIMPGYNTDAFSGPYANWVHDPATDALVARAEATQDPTARLALYQQAENALINDAVVIPIAQEQGSWLAAPTVAALPADPAPWIAPTAWARIYLTNAGQ